MDLASELKYFALSQGIAAIGTAPTAAYTGAPAGHRPEDYLPSACTVITFTYPLGKTVFLNLPRTRNLYTAEFNAANQLISVTVHKMARLLEEKGHASLPVGPEAAPADPARLKADFSHKHSAVLCGLGKFGRNNLLLTPGHGPAVRLGSVITTADITLDVPPGNKSPCDGCTRCVEMCPVGALDGYRDSYSPTRGRRMDKEKCYHYMFVAGGGARCGLCIKACLEVHFKPESSES